MIYSYAAIVKKSLGNGSYSTQLHQGFVRRSRSEDEAIGTAYTYLRNKHANTNVTVEDLIVLKVPCDCSGEDE